MNKLRKVSMIFAFATVLSLTAYAQIPTQAPSPFKNFTNTAGTATNINMVIDVSKQKSTALQWKFQMDAASTTNRAFAYVKSVDGVSYETTPYVVTVAANGTTPVVTVTNLDSFGASYLKILWVTNSGTANTTNESMVYNIKLSAP
jgi:hypothetical protein